MKSFFYACACITVATALLVGCNSSGPGLAKATGTVTYKGKPLVGANIKFYPENGPMATAITDDQGAFSVTTNGRPGAVIGLHKVSISKMSDDAAVAKMPSSPSPDDMRKMAIDSMKKPSGPKSEIPEKYSSPDSSDLKADVSSDSSQNVYEFPLQ